MKIKGNILKARRSFVEEQFGEDAWQEVITSLSAEDRQILGGIISHGTWYPFALGSRLDEAIVEVLAEGRTEVFEELGRTSARCNLTTVHKMLIAEGDPQVFMAKASQIYRFYYEIGHRSWEPTGPTSGVMTTHGADTFSAVDCLTVIGWYKEALLMCGAKHPEIIEEECCARGGKVCRYRVSWQER